MVVTKAVSKKKPPKEARQKRQQAGQDSASAGKKVEKSDSEQKGKKFLHVRLDGKSKHFLIADLPISAKSPDEEILAALAKHLRIEIERFTLFQVERTKDGNIYVRPEAVFSDA